MADAIVRRAQQHAELSKSDETALAARLRQRIADILDDWSQLASARKEKGATFQYQEHEATRPVPAARPARPHARGRVEARAQLPGAPLDARRRAERPLWVKRLDGGCRPARRPSDGAPAGDDPPEPAHHHLRAGAMVDLPRHSVVVGGLEEWNLGPNKRRISEDRLVAKIQELLECPTVQLFAPPAESDDPRAVPTGITAWQFPEWFIAQTSPRLWSRRRPLVHQLGLVPYKGGWRYEDPETGRRCPVVPIRFVQGCINGHLSDIDWIKFVHEGGERRMRPGALDRGARDERRHPRRLHRVRVRRLQVHGRSRRSAGRTCSASARGAGRGSATTRGRGAAAPRARRSRTGCCCATPPTPTSRRCCGSSRSRMPTRTCGSRSTRSTTTSSRASPRSRSFATSGRRPR